uniref:t-SNARE coiled-coil homology domain-containing protein n=1 Tax=Trichuris muris TaxID=70415 RepID=A0A5S6R0I6_TRIMR
MHRAGSSGSAANMSKQHYLESDNDQMVDGLKHKVTTLKSLTIDIGDEVRRQNKELGGLEDHFESSRNVLEATMRRLGLISRSGGARFTLYLVLFSFMVFVMMYYIIRR